MLWKLWLTTGSYDAHEHEVLILKYTKQDMIYLHRFDTNGIETAIRRPVSNR